MPQLYFRPFGLVFGADARMMIAAGEAGSLGGMAHIAFTQVEKITRDGKAITRSTQRFEDIKNHSLTDEIARPRDEMAGLRLGQSRIMGIVNVTPDSFSDGGQHNDSQMAIDHGSALADAGADILDIGGESTRPGSDEVSLDEERRRIIPVVAALSAGNLVSVDTRKSILMRESALAGAKIINDVSALGFDAKSAQVVAQLGLPIILMHAQGEPRTMQLAPKYDDVALDVYDWLADRIDHAVAAGIPKSKICVDPGIGFGKTITHNLELLRRLTLFHGLGVALLVGLSRKNLVGVLTAEMLASKRVSGSVGGALHCAMQGAHILRVHDVRETVDALAVFNACRDPDSAGV
jgi:dihydropteroate synthase